jgi:hypothetical protein
VQVPVTDADPTRAGLLDRGVEVSEIRELGRADRPSFRFVVFTDPDGNGWIVQEAPLAGRDPSAGKVPPCTARWLRRLRGSAVLVELRALVAQERDLAQADPLRGDLDALVVTDELHGLVE